MKKTLLTFLLFPVLCASAHAQITVDSADFGVMGDVVPVFRDTAAIGLTISGGSAQAQDWDYSSLNVHEYDSIVFRDPQQYPDGAQFPDADFVLPYILGEAFIKKTDSNLLVLGMAGAGDDFGVSVPFMFEEPSTVLNFPSTLGSTFTESNMSSQTIPSPVPEADSVIIDLDVQTFSEFDAYGSLKTPAGEYAQTIRQYVKLDFVIDVKAIVQLPVIGRTELPLFDTAFTTYSYNWFEKNADYTLLEIAADDQNGNVINATYHTGEKPLPVLNVDAVECPGDSNGAVTVEQVVGGVAPYTYLWSTEETQAQVTGLSQGIYFVTVYDSQNDSTVTRIEMNTNDSIDVDETISAPSGSGLEDGSVNLDNVTGGQGPYLFNWSNGSQMRNLEDVRPGIYTVTITDFNGCTAEFSYEVPGAVSAQELNREGNTKVFPVPFENILHITSDERITQVMVFDVTGTLVRAARPQNVMYRMNTSDLPAGFYIMKIQNETGKEILKRVVKQ